jgi:hypothetical protein
MVKHISKSQQRRQLFKYGGSSIVCSMHLSVQNLHAGLLGNKLEF